MHVCACSYKHVHDEKSLHTCVCMLIQMCVDQKAASPVVSILLYLIFLRHGLSLNLDFRIQLEGLPTRPSVHPVSISQTLGVQVCAATCFHLGSHACIVSTFSTELP